ncbi:MAG: 3-keto-disaccharide hydrolase, partial [Gemmatimonadaceae bacterium]
MIHRAAARAAIVGQLILIFAGCTQMGNGVPVASTTASGATPLTAEQTAAGWRSLFDGTSLAAWRGYKEAGVPAGWHIVDGILTKSGSVNDLITRDQFGNFELALDWKLAPGGNAGVFYRGTEEYDHIYWSAPEYQLLDDAGHPDGKSRLTSAGSDYAHYPSPPGVVKPADQWNSTLLVVNGNHVQHWLNGQKVVDYDLGSPDWEAKVKASKFAA